MSNGPTRIVERLIETVGSAQSLLDVGSGPGTYTRWMARIPARVALDIDAESLKQIEDPSIIRIRGLADFVIEQFMDECFDAVIALDFIEHLAKNVALFLIGEMKRISRCVVLFTPSGFMPQEVEGKPYQKHLSGWSADELRELGFTVEEWTDFDYGVPTPAGGLWAVWRK